MVAAPSGHTVTPATTRGTGRILKPLLITLLSLAACVAPGGAPGTGAGRAPAGSPDGPALRPRAVAPLDTTTSGTTVLAAPAMRSDAPAPAVATASVLSHPTAAAAPPCGPAPQHFSVCSFWNTGAAAAAVDPDSAAFVRALVGQVRAYGTHFNTTAYSTPVYTVPFTQPDVQVHMATSDGALADAMRSVPLPPTARPAAGSDAHLVLIQPSTDTMWEFWHLRLWSDGWHATYGGVIAHLSQSLGRYESPHAAWGATATSLPLLGGLITLRDLQRGVIDHAIALSIPAPARGECRTPAQRTDGAASPGGIPEGMWFRVDPRLDIASLGLPRLPAMIATALQRYGMFVRDKAASVVMYGEDPAPTGGDPWAPAAGGLGPQQILQSLPWASMQALAPPANA